MMSDDKSAVQLNKVVFCTIEVEYPCVSYVFEQSFFHSVQIESGVGAQSEDTIRMRKRRAAANELKEVNKEDESSLLAM